METPGYQFYQTVATCEQQKICQFQQVAVSLLKSGLLQLVICRLLTINFRKQLAESLWIINRYDNHFHVQICNVEDCLPNIVDNVIIRIKFYFILRVKKLMFIYAKSLFSKDEEINQSLAVSQD